ncbi:hypothetical protein evm_008479 [Chilo suppressalis]|nr:hypothetical protein evm_008479 [Chilo suppressalis]
MLLEVRTSATRDIPSNPGYRVSIRAMRHFKGGRLASLMTTSSPSSKPLSFTRHFVFSCSSLSEINAANLERKIWSNTTGRSQKTSGDDRLHTEFQIHLKMDLKKEFEI